MAFSRYTRDDIGRGGLGLSVALATRRIRAAMRDGFIVPDRTLIVTQRDRLDTIAGEVYGDGRYWWVLAAASNIGWSLQVPPGVVINVLDLNTVERLVG